MTGVGAAATADAHALGPVSTRSATSSAIYSTQCLGCDREGGCGPLSTECRSPAHRQFIADTGRAHYHRSTAGADATTLARCSWRLRPGMPKGGHCKAAPAVGGNAITGPAPRDAGPP